MLSRASPSSASGHLLPSSPGETVLQNDDLLAQILVCLPPKSILKFKSVSKHWLAIITSPDFVPKRHSKAISGLCFGLEELGFPKPKPSYGFINLSCETPSSSRAPFTTLNFSDDPSGIKIIQSCNGLFLCSSNRDSSSTERRSFYVYNPTTNRSTALPELWIQHPSLVGGRKGSLAFDPSKSPHYKVIHVTYISSESYFATEHYFILTIYSSETRAWKRCGDPFLGTHVDFRDGVFWNGSVHWASLNGEPSLRFDVEQEQIRDLPMPPLLKTKTKPEPDSDEGEDVLRRMMRGYRSRFLGESGNRLNFLEIHGSKPLQFEVYEVEPDYSGWFVKYTVDLRPVVEAFPERVLGNFCNGLNSVLSILSVVREVEDDDGDESYLVLLLPNSHMAVRYKLNDGSFSKICDLDPHGCRVEYDFQMYAHIITQSVYPFIPSLASV